MIQWLKNFFKTTPGEGVVPITVQKEYVYMGDGTMEEVVKSELKDLYSTMTEEELQKRLTRLREQREQKAQAQIRAGNVGVGAVPLDSKKLKEHLDARRTNHIDTTPIVIAAAVSSWTGDSSYSSYDSGSCDSSSSSCD